MSRDAAVRDHQRMSTARKKRCISMFLLPMLLACTGAPAAEPPLPREPSIALSGKLLISGSSTMAPMIMEAAARFSALHPGVRIDVQTVGTGRGIDDVVKGRSGIGMASRALTDRESALYSFAIARDGVCLVVHRSNPIRTLTNRQVSDIFTGRIANWSRVGGNDAPIAAINAKEGFGAVELFLQHFGIKYAEIKSHVMANGNPDRIRLLIENPNGVAYMSLGSAQHALDAGAPLKLLPIDGVAATSRNIRTGNFPISRPLLLLTRDVPAGVAKEFIRFALSSQMTDIVLKHDYVAYLD